MFHGIIFLLVIVSSLSCNFNRCARSFSVIHEHRLQELSQNCARIKTFFKITHRYNTLILKNRHNKLFIMLKRNSINVH